LRWAGGAAGVDQPRRFGRQGALGLEVAVGAGQRGFPVERLAQVTLRARDADHVPQPRTRGTRVAQVAAGSLIDDHDFGFAVLQPVFERVRPEQDRQRHRDRAELVARNVDDRRFRALRQDQRDPVAFFYAQRAQHIRQQVGLLLQLRVRHTGGLARFILVMDRDARRVGGPARAAEVGDIQLCRHMPAELVVQRGVAVGRGGACGHSLSNIISERSFGRSGCSVVCRRGAGAAEGRIFIMPVPAKLAIARLTQP